MIGLIAWTWVQSPKHPQRSHFGDDAEYLLGAKSFARHGTPDCRDGDRRAVLARLPKKWRAQAARSYDHPEPWGYFKANDGKVLAWHFWLYPAAVAPFKAVLDRHGLGSRAFLYANLTFFTAALLSLLQLRSQPRLWLLLVPLSFFTPALWFLPLAHTEAFVFSLGLIATTCYLSGRRQLALLFNSLAAMQFQPLAILSLFLFGENVWFYTGGRFDRPTLTKQRYALLKSALAAAIVLIPGLFYYAYFGTPSLVAREGYAKNSLMSLDKLVSMFVDLNTGLLIYLPGVLLLWTWSLVIAAQRSVRTRSIVPLLAPASVVLVLWASTSARIWSYHTQGISRYALYTVPAMLLVIGLQQRAAGRLSRSSIVLVLLALCLQATTHRQFGWFAYRGSDNLHHNPIAKLVLLRKPALYSPPPEIFCSRTLHKRCWIDLNTGYVTNDYLPAVWSTLDETPLKALIQRCDLKSTLHARRWKPEQVERIKAAVCANGEPTYVDFR